MTELSKDLPRSESRDELVKAVEDTLRTSNWVVVDQPVGALHPDIVARDPDGAPYVFEIKAGPEQAHLGAVAQVEAYRDSLAEQLGEQAKGVLVLTGEAPEELDGVASNAGVELVRADSDEPEAVRDSLLSLSQPAASAGTS